jgi:hypothetical protein
MFLHPEESGVNAKLIAHLIEQDIRDHDTNHDHKLNFTEFFDGMYNELEEHNVGGGRGWQTLLALSSNALYTLASCVKSHGVESTGTPHIIRSVAASPCPLKTTWRWMWLSMTWRAVSARP